MNQHGLTLCSRFAYPPNSYALCGPSKQNDLCWYASNVHGDKGLSDILSQFTTLYPYLCFIAGENNIKDPFDPLVVEAYWIGNSLLEKTSQSRFALYLEDTLGVKKRITRTGYTTLLSKLHIGALPHHAFHVINIWRRTGHDDSPHSAKSMEACLINWGKVTKIMKYSLTIDTYPLIYHQKILKFGSKQQRNIRAYALNQNIHQITVGDWISYHWGILCVRISLIQLQRLIFYTQKAIHLFNQTTSYETKNYIYHR
ncbi:MAG TPA: DUF6390 family protein [Patescibacteria group bacterium]|nr:DUF6390 family protein [Patescibacteria group bacterium]